MKITLDKWTTNLEKMTKRLLMRFLVLGSIISCSTTSYKPLKKFTKQWDCSIESINYFWSTKSKTKASVDKKKVKEILVQLSLPINECYQNEINESKAKSMNICFVIGYDKTGK